MFGGFVVVLVVFVVVVCGDVGDEGWEVFGG